MERDQKQNNGETPPLVPPRRQATIAPSDVQQLARSTETDNSLLLSGNERHYRSLTSTTAQIFWTAKANGTVEDIPMWRAYTGQLREEVEGRGWLKALHPDDIKRVIAEGQRAFRDGDIFELEYRLLRYDGIYRTFLARGIPVFELDGHVREWVGASTDITEKKLLEDELRESEQRFRATFEQAEIGIAHIDLEGHFLLANQKFCDISGFTYTQLQSPTIGELLLTEELETIAENVYKLMMGEIQTYCKEVHYIRNNGLPIWVNLTLSIVRDAMGKPSYCLSTTEDITDRKLEERRTHDALNALLAMAESLVVLPDETEATSSIFTAHEITQNLTELTCKVLGCQHVGLLALEPRTDEIIPMATVGFALNDEKNEAIVNLFKQQFVEKLTATYMTQLQANEIVIVDQEHFPTLPDGTHFTLVAPMKVYNQFIGILFLGYGTEEHAYTNNKISLIKAVARLAALIIERQRLLNERAEAQAAELAQREANRRMDDFLSIASHELRTPLTTISIHIQMANRLLHKVQQQFEEEQQGEHSLYAPLQDMLIGTEVQVEVLNRLVNDLIDISRIQTNKLELHTRLQPCDLIVLLQEVATNQRYRTPLRTINLDLPLAQAASSIFVMADPDRITQVIVNYLTNALTYSAPDTIVTLALQTQGDKVRIAVCDQGLGLSSEEQANIWDRFYQVNNHRMPMHTTSVGLGLGLYISRSLVEQHGGQVGVESTLGIGSTFWFTLPLMP
ncbi:MAG: PAS domain S-box protein [Ktedonobacteraceae bacterium]|nr:PAS domain S-box protein [Ktedonobacteraceae bacterium]